jgi:hypothetical protein
MSNCMTPTLTDNKFLARCITGDVFHDYPASV